MLEKIRNYCSYCSQCTGKAFWSSWDSANNAAGTVIGGGIALLVPLPIISGVSDTIKWENSAISLVVYTIGAWIILLILRAIFVSPYRLWKEADDKVKDLEAKLRTKIEEPKVEEWLLPTEAVKKFCDETLFQKFLDDPENPNIHQAIGLYLTHELRKGQLKARGIPRTAAAHENQFVVIKAAQWQNLDIGGGMNFSNAGGGSHIYDSLEIGKAL